MTKTELLTGMSNGEILTISRTTKIPFVTRYIVEGTRVKMIGMSKEGLCVKIRVISISPEAERQNRKDKLPIATFGDVYAVSPSSLK